MDQPGGDKKRSKGRVHGTEKAKGKERDSKAKSSGKGNATVKVGWVGLPCNVPLAFIILGCV